MNVANVGDPTVSAYRTDSATGSLTPVAGSPFAVGQNPYSIAIDPLGRYAYVANAEGTVAGFSIEATTGALVTSCRQPVCSRHNSGRRCCLTQLGSRVRREPRSSGKRFGVLHQLFLVAG